MNVLDDGHTARRWLPRFLSPRHAVVNYAIMRWQGIGDADTPGADAECRLHIACDGLCEQVPIAAAAFAAFGPPVVIACADWACEWLEQRTIGDAHGLSVAHFEQALALAPSERYAALLVLDALAGALENSRLDQDRPYLGS